MRHIFVAVGMLVAALVITFAAASIIEGRAVASGPSSNEPFVLVDTARSALPKAMATKDRATSQLRERRARSPSVQFGL